jgi:hypothetical protein
MNINRKVILVLFNTFTFIIMLTIIIIGVCISDRKGMDSISDMISDHYIIRVFYIIIIIVIHEVTALVLIIQKNPCYFGIVLGVMRCIFLTMVAIVDIDETPLGHYIVTICAFNIAAIRHAIFMKHNNRSLFSIEGTTIWMMSIFMIAYGITIRKLPSAEYVTGVAVVEYLGVMCVVYLNQFHILDIVSKKSITT